MNEDDCLVTDEATEERVIQFIELSEADQALALSLLDQTKKLRKVCPECEGRGWIGHKVRKFSGKGIKEKPVQVICFTCHGTGLIPMTAEDVEVRVKG